MSAKLHIVKLSVGTDSPDSLAAWQATAHAQGPDGLPRHITRMWPKRQDELLQGGSIYWVIKGTIQARQTIRRLDEVIGQDGIRRCAIVLDPAIIRTAAAPRRAFQGWRYLNPEDAPPDLPKSRESENLPPELSAALSDIGLI